MVYTTSMSVSEYIGIPVMDLPTNITKMIIEASLLMDYASLNRIQEYYIDSNTLLFTDADIEEKVRIATNQQIEFWIESGGDSFDITGNSIGSFNIGNFSVSYGSGSSSTSAGNTQNVLAPRSKRTLLLAGLLFRGIAR
jgi:hypothetical protein